MRFLCVVLLLFLFYLCVFGVLFLFYKSSDAYMYKTTTIMKLYRNAIPGNFLIYIIFLLYFSKYL